VSPHYDTNATKISLLIIDISLPCWAYNACGGITIVGGRVVIGGNNPAAVFLAF
jgi:hypothetical protein